jgi:hypothetical protein
VTRQYPAQKRLVTEATRWHSFTRPSLANGTNASRSTVRGKDRDRWGKTERFLLWDSCDWKERSFCPRLLSPLSLTQRRRRVILVAHRREPWAPKQEPSGARSRGPQRAPLLRSMGWKPGSPASAAVAVAGVVQGGIPPAP